MNAQPRLPIFTVYKTTCLVNGKIYIGVHKTRDPDDSYLGSGKVLCQAVEKHGRDAFTKEVLFLFDTRKEAYEKERELVHEAFVKRADTYNVMVGGVVGGWYDNHKGEKNSQYGTVWVWREGAKPCKIPALELKAACASGWIPGRGPQFSRKMGEVCQPSNLEEWVLRGPSHPDWGKVWVYRGPERKRVPAPRLACYLTQGWARGMKASPPRRPKTVRRRAPRGEKVSSSKLTWEAVREIRRQHSAEERTTLQEFSSRYGVSRMAISKVLRGLTWIE
jgi:hypothetical protein